MAVVVEEADESQFWLELLSESGAVRSERLDELKNEAQELTALFTAAQFTARSRR
jgi:four helix bundle protein